MFAPSACIHLSLLLGELRRHHPHHRRQGQERHAASGPRGRRSRSSHQSRHALSQGLVADAGHPERPAPAEAAGAPARLRSLGRHRLGPGLSTKSRATSRRRATKRSSPPTRRAAPSIALESIAWNGGCTDTNEFNYPGRQNHAQPGRVLPRKSGQGLTRPHGLQFGAHVRTRRHDQWLDRHQEHRHDVDHGRQSGREPSLRI